MLIFCMSMFLFGCGNNTKEEWNRLKGTNSIGMTREEYLNSLDSADLQNSLVYLASDTAFTTNANLLLLLDTLYQHIRKDEFPYDVKKEEKWMAGYRSKLAAYYDSSYGKDTLSILIKADSVLNDGVRLLELDCDRSTMGMIVDNVVQLTLNRCKEYGLLSQLIESCKTNDAKELVYKEWALYEQMLKKIRLITANMANLNYWGGSIASPLRTASYLHISQSRMDMYQTLLNIARNEDWDDTGVYPENAKRLLFDCCATAIEVVENEADECDREYDSEEMRKEFDKTIKETELVTQELRPIVDEWIMLLDQLDEALTHDNNRYSVERAASYMIMKWASIVTPK